MLYIGTSEAKKFSDKSIAINYLISKKRLNKNKCVYVGDTFEDQISSEKCGIKFIPALYGFYSWNNDNSEQFKIETISKLIKFGNIT